MAQLAAAVLVSRGSQGMEIVNESVEIKKLGAVTDNVFGQDHFSIQQEVASIPSEKKGWQNVLEAYPDKLIWKINVFDYTKPAGQQLVALPTVQINDMNIDTLRQPFITVDYSTGLLGGTQFMMSMSIRTVDGTELYQRRTLPGDQAGHVLSSFVVFCGLGGNQVGPGGPSGSSATFDSSLDVVVTHSVVSIDPSDSYGFGYTLVPQDSSVPALSALEGSNTAQQVIVRTQQEVQSSIKVGDWQSSLQPTRTGILVVFYIPPTDPAWDALVQARSSSPTVPITAIINPSNGPGTSQDQNYVNGIQKLQAAGVKVLGYVHSSYGNRQILDVKSDIAKYKGWYPSIDGIFIDEMANSTGWEAYYNEVQLAIDPLLGVGNPGTNFAPSYQGIFDVLVVYENAGMPTATQLSKYSPKTWFAYIADEVSSFPADTLKDYVGWLYIYDLTTNDYNTLSKWFPQMLQALT